MSWRQRWFPNGEWVLLLVLAAETLFFSLVAPNFFTLGNFFEMTRFSVELGLLAVALTPVIVAGGIDLSVGSMMGLAAVTFGAGYHALQLPLPLAIAGALLVGLAGGALNALLIARLKLPALIVTLGTFSLFRGVAEGLTQAPSTTPGFLRVPVPGPGVLPGLVPRSCRCSC
jgi:rhamnose transport system permease protein